MQSKAPGAECWRCPLKENACAKTTGPSDATIAVVSRSPGKQEALQGKSFSGLSGKVLNHLLGLYGYTREDVLATNVVLCQCEEVPQEAIDACSGRLANEISNCDTIIAAGAEAAKAFTGDASISIYRARGVVYRFNRTNNNSSNNEQGRLIITNNPAVVLRDDSTYLDLVRDFRLALAPRPRRKLPRVRYTDDKQEARNWIATIRDQFTTGGITVGTDIEARGRDNRTGLEHNAEIVCAGFATRSDHAVVFGENICTDENFLRSHLRPLWEIDNVNYLFHNGKYDVKILINNGINARVDHDTMLLSYALDERPGDPTKGHTGHSLEYLLKEYLGYPLYEPHSVGVFKKTGVLASDSDRHNLYTYNGIDTAGCVGLYEELKRAAELDNVFSQPYFNHLLRINRSLIKIELEGWPFDDELACNLLESAVWPQLLELEAECQRLANDDKLNLNSPQQLIKLYYDIWGIKHKLRRPKIENKGKRSSDKYVRRELKEDRFESTFDRVIIREFAKTADRHAELDTQRTNFFEALIRKQYPNGRVYYDFLIHGTESGRLSGRNPNMQNITRPKENLPSIRECFVADPGHVILNCDLSQAELRTIAYLSQDENLCTIYRDTSRSLHKETAKEFYGEKYTYEQYVLAKNINFGVAYLQSAFSFAQLYEMDQKEAQRYIDWWWARFPKVRVWVDIIIETLVNEGELVSPFGHKRRFYLITNESKDHAIKEAVNFIPQNVAANLTLAAMCDVTENIDWDIAQVKSNTHDSITLHVQKRHVEEIAHFVLNHMEAAPVKYLNWNFPFKAEATYGENWGRCDTPIERQ